MCCGWKVFFCVGDEKVEVRRGRVCVSERERKKKDTLGSFSGKRDPGRRRFLEGGGSERGNPATRIPLIGRKDPAPRFLLERE